MMKQATNAAIMRVSNRKLILNLIRLQPISRVEIAEQVHLTRASITQIVDELLEAGLVEPVATEQRNTTGRRRTKLALCHNARFVFGVNIRRSHCYVGAIDLYGDVLSRRDIPFNGRSAEDVIDTVAETILAQITALDLPREKILGIGVSAPGPVDYRTGTILNPPNFPLWHNIDICARLTAATGINAALEKDTNARALEEKYFGAAKDSSNFLLIQVDDGVGSGIMIHDRLYRGANGFGTEIGHISIRYDGPQCECGGRGCLENYLNIPALLRGTRFRAWEEMAYDIDTQDAENVLKSAAEYLSAALINSFNMFDLERVILTGDIALNPEPLVSRVNDMIRLRTLSRDSIDGIPVHVSKAASPVRTGAMAALHEVFEER